MTHKQAIKIIKKAVDYYIKKMLSVDANLFDNGLCDNKHAERCSDERNKMLEALALVSNQETLL